MYLTKKINVIVPWHAPSFPLLNIAKLLTL